MQIIRSVLCIFLLVVTITGKAQTDLPEIFNNLQKDGSIPEDLQSTRSAVFIKMNILGPLDSAAWYAVAEEFHKGLAAINIDAVAYYRWRDLNAGFDATNSFLEAISERGVSQIIILEVAQGDYQIYIIPSIEGTELLPDNPSAWHISGSTLENAISALSLSVKQAGLEVANFLISETPEFFMDTPIFQKNRFESFQPDLKLDKLAVPLFQGIDSQHIQSQEDLELQSILQNLYPFEYQLVGAKMSEDLMKKAGFHYVLRYLHAEESVLLDLLDYETQDRVSSALRYKFYFKHLITGDIYLGDRWDSRPNWQQALHLHLVNMRSVLKVE